ncbi:MAG: hypothetical protein KBT20_11150 [Bacteroidales bacterium]|nr:hypothetical protein [Candidatus Liminaster caballi]
MRYAALCCYFGQWPSHFRFWLRSCSYNPQIRFILVSDIPVDGYDLPENVQLVRQSFADVKKRIARTFPEITVSVDRPYKLCDFKTAYGRIFNDLFEGCDYWGFYDIDTVWGDILKFVPANEDCHLTKIFPCGHLCFVRNAEPWNNVFRLINEVAGTPCRNNMSGRKVVTWQECFSSPESHYYDEEGGLEPLFESKEGTEGKEGGERKDSVEKIDGKERTGLVQIYADVTFDNILPPWRFDHFLSINFPEKSHNLVYSYDCGHLYRHYLRGLHPCREEISYLHASKRSFTVSATDTSRFIIYPNKVAEYRDWTILGLLIHGRVRRLRNLVRRIGRRIRIIKDF